MRYPLRHLANHLRRGKRGEKLARHYLKQQGLTILHTNQSYPNIGELDIIAEEKGSIIFVEVRTRQHNAMVSAVESITPHKMHKCRRAAAHYLQIHYGDNPPACRFDAICITMIQESMHNIQWLKNII